MTGKKPNNLFLFSVDLEDARENVANGHQYPSRVVINTTRYMDWLRQKKCRCTFFTVGKIAEDYPELIKEIMLQGHEIACHSYAHTPVDKLGEDNFKRDLDKTISALLRAGAGDIRGFRAPVFSITEKTPWAYDALKASGFSYSSSVLPAKNPLYGWENFGESVRKMENGILEIPITLGRFGPLNVPIAGGVYFRALPRFFIFNSIKQKLNDGLPVLSYFHPYDIDVEQDRYMHAGINDSKFFNWLMYYNRKNVFSRLNSLLQSDVSIIPYNEFVKGI